MRILQVSLLVGALLVGITGLGIAQESGIRIMRDILATAVENRQPVEANGGISADVAQLFYFTDVQGGPGTIQHVWIWQGRTMATVSLEIKSARFRTWSSKRIQPEWTGKWRVEARSSDGAVLSFKEFEIE